MTRSHDLDVQVIKSAILQYARARDADSAAVVHAMAEVLALIALNLDRGVGYQAFDERAAEFVDMARSAYMRAVPWPADSTSTPLAR